MHPTLQLLERHTDELSSQTIHWFDLPEPCSFVKPTDMQFNLDWSPANTATLGLTQWPTTDINILFNPKAKDRLDWWLGQISASMSAGQKIWLVGENNSGIKSIPKRLKDFFHCEKLDTARHCALYELTPSGQPMSVVEPKEFNHMGNNFIGYPGVFSAGRLDKGTEVLLSVLPQLKGNVLEFGAGCGVLTAALASQDKTTHVDAVEIDMLGVMSAIANLKTAQLDSKSSVIWSAGIENLPKKTYDVIVTNPPFHKGINTEYGPTERFFEQANQWLRPKGQIIWVANDFLNYQSMLNKAFKTPVTLAHVKGFRVLSATLG
jgi:16S rRNA (guanine1207-N2)-methyltransferase